ncbi:N-acetylglucosamine-6-phosphate deacetylase [Acidianus sulfidivorans JP7]|uniref:N-acetylglucosamine-6-phosphate deacetylase n=1 Tax=Acidianus sulfidivorans JP7 TaxID=619593 RepID=A0A2U9ILF9_9CREN|nr:N-acetylglucosamine-6-phosphate deacetylase [Acidianus sulfidivorans]AWR96888.1 N-acetylglucosamine-6-phosphate deacetylase [Acidianus sulfidivorans JP7]
MKLVNARIITPYREILGNIEIENGTIKKIYEGHDSGENLEGMIVVPGFIDIHIHGINGFDFTSWDNKDDFIKNAFGMKKSLLKHGVTTFLPTTVTIPRENLMEACKAIGEIDDQSIFGIHLEGPYISEKHAGAQDVKYIRNPDINEIKECIKFSKGKLKTITIAPEKDLNFIREIVNLGIHPSIGHTDADYETGVKAFLLGADRTTHIFNAMRGFHHRDPGVILASLNFSRYIEIITDFIHVNREVVKFLIYNFGINRFIAVTDSIIATDMEDGEYSLGKTKIIVKNGIAMTSNGRLAGSTLTMDKAFRNLFSIIGLQNASIMCSYNPANSIGLNDRGVIEVGKRADLVVLDEKMNVKKVYVNGEEVF